MTPFCFADGNSIVTEKIFLDRFLHVSELTRMGLWSTARAGRSSSGGESTGRGPVIQRFVDPPVWFWLVWRGGRHDHLEDLPSRSGLFQTRGSTQ